jgi:phenylpropionate dioxygenase-like ring-hydroxylating dioxygenase large terminal subunit
MKPGWHPVARSNELPSEGDYRSVDLFGEPLVVLRDEAGRLRAYSRVCRHRAFTFVQGQGNTKRFICPYHLWTYDLQGELRSAPLMENVAGFERKDCRLPELPLEEWRGFVFVSLDPNAQPLSPKLAPLDGLLASCDLAELVTVDTLVFDSPWNWKVMVDNFIESYHHLGVHETLQRTNPAQGTHALDFEGPFLVLENPGANDQPPFWVVQVFPTLLLALFRGDAPVGTWYEMKIDRHDHFELHIHLLAPPAFAENQAAVDFFRETATLIHRQDIPMCEGVQQGLNSELWQPGRLSKQEGALWLFHRYLVEQLTRA